MAKPKMYRVQPGQGAAQAQAPPLRPRMRAYNGIYRASLRYPPYSLDQLTQQKGYDVADNMLTLGACRSPFNLKRYAVMSDGWEIVPAVTDAFDTRYAAAKEYADFAKWVFSNMCSRSGYAHEMTTTLFEIMRGMWEGFRVGELLWDYIEDGEYAGQYGLRGIAWKPAKQTGFDYDPETQEPLFVTSYTPGSSGNSTPGTRGYPNADVLVPGGYDFQVPIERCVIYSYNTDGGLINSPGDWRPCYKHWMQIDGNMWLWGRALERWGSPMIIATAESNNQAQITAAQQLLEEIQQGSVPVMPSNIKWELAKAEGTVFDSFYKTCRWNEEQIAKAIHSSTLISSADSGTNTNALGDVHQETSETVYGHARNTIQNAINRQVIAPLMRYNFDGFDQELTPRLSLGGDNTDNILGLMQAFDLGLKDGVIWKGEKWIRERLGWNPLTPEDQQAMQQEQEQQQQAELEAQKQIADMRNSGKVGAMAPQEVERAMALLTQAILSQQYIAANA